jgi:hypothetical protein
MGISSPVFLREDFEIRPGDAQWPDSGTESAREVEPFLVPEDVRS